MSADRKNCDIFQSNYRDLRSKKKKKKIEQKTLHSQKKCELALTCLLYNFSCFSISQKNSNAIKKKKVDLGRQRL